MAMSDDLIFRYVTSSSYPTFTCAECGVALCTHAAAVISVLHKTEPAERAILTDLIAELRDEHRIVGDGYCEACDVEPFPCASGRAVNWAEARLREVSGDGDE